jgi:formylglycine-generating enzyme required for sulfatase activity
MENERNNGVQMDSADESKSETKSSKKFKWFYLIILACTILGLISLVYFLRPDPKKPFTNSIDMKLVWIQPGEFMMGSSLNVSKAVSDYGGNASWYTDEYPQHKVILTKGFWMAETEVTQAQYKAIMNTNPSRFKGDNNPVEKVNWHDAIEFCKKLSQKEGKSYTLPTEAQWEYACRAGSVTEYCFGNNSNQLSDYAWYWYDSKTDKKTHPVGLKYPNVWGLYDMYGNVWEWCSDWYDMDFYSRDAKIDPLNNSYGDHKSRVLRGGGWDGYGFLGGDCRSSNRGKRNPDDRSGGTGFRIIRLQK